MSVKHSVVKHQNCCLTDHPKASGTAKFFQDIQDIDRFAWECICNWPKFSELEIIRDGLNYSELTRYFLWGKVSRAIRSKLSPENFRFEQEILYLDQTGISDSPSSTRIDRLNFALKAIRLRIKTLTSQSQPIIYTPIPEARLEKVVSSLSRSNTALMVSQKTDLAGFQTTHQITPVDYGILPDFEFSVMLHEEIIKSLEYQGIELLQRDKDILKAQICQQLKHIKNVELEIRRLRPSAILAHTDNYYPIIDYILVARREGIPAIMLQHGLDCEHFYLDEPYASAVAVWGPARKQRYQKDAKRKTCFIEVTGNPNFDEKSLPDKIDHNGDYLLWVTRPHRSDKCLSVTRDPREGMAILEALQEILSHFPKKRLVIKPHRGDYVEAYKQYIANNKFHNQIQIKESSLEDLLPDAKIVITEDSTSGMEAMFYGKPLIHAHFATSASTVPFVDYGAALPGFSKEMLINSLSKVKRLTLDEYQNLLNGQRKFLQAYAGLCDGKATDRCTSFVSKVLAFS